jgi:hypothetical protein
MIGSMPISWGSKEQSTVSLSSTEVEYIALYDAVCEVKFITQVLDQHPKFFCSSESKTCENARIIIF